MRSLCGRYRESSGKPLVELRPTWLSETRRTRLSVPLLAGPRLSPCRVWQIAINEIGHER